MLGILKIYLHNLFSLQTSRSGNASRSTTKYKKREIYIGMLLDSQVFCEFCTSFIVVILGFCAGCLIIKINNICDVSDAHPLSPLSFWVLVYQRSITDEIININW